MAKLDDITIKLTVKISLWDCIKLRIIGPHIKQWMVKDETKI